MGYSTGGYCAMNIALRHPDRYASAVSLSGYDEPYLDATTGHLFGASREARDANDPLWRLRHLAAPDVSLLLASTGGDPVPARESRQMALAARPPTQVDLLPLRQGGHDFAMFRIFEPAAFDWISRQISAPLAPSVVIDGTQPAAGHA
jgi:S-formylglutathione hydrolase FrmB